MIGAMPQAVAAEIARCQEYRKRGLKPPPPYIPPKREEPKDDSCLAWAVVAFLVGISL